MRPSFAQSLFLRLFTESLSRDSLFQFVKRQNPNGLFVTEANQEGITLSNHIPQAVIGYSLFLLPIVDTGVWWWFFSNSTPLGALTNGRDWIFLVFHLNENKIGGTHWESSTVAIQLSAGFLFAADSMGPDILTGVRPYWVGHIALPYPRRPSIYPMEQSFAALDENDYFRLHT